MSDFFSVLVSSVLSFDVAHYESVNVLEELWTNSITSTKEAKTDIHCAVMCSKTDCNVWFLFEGVCQMAEAFLPTSKSQKSTLVYREIKGKMFVCFFVYLFDISLRSEECYCGFQHLLQFSF